MRTLLVTGPSKVTLRSSAGHSALDQASSFEASFWRRVIVEVYGRLRWRDAEEAWAGGWSGGRSPTRSFHIGTSLGDLLPDQGFVVVR